MDYETLSADAKTRQVICSFKCDNYNYGEMVYNIRSVSYTENSIAVVSCDAGIAEGSGETGYSYVYVNWEPAVVVVDLFSGRMLDQIDGYRVHSVIRTVFCCKKIQRKAEE